MKKMLGVCVVVMVLAACGRDRTREAPRPQAPAPEATAETATPPDAAPPGSTWMELRLQGDNAAGYDAALVTVSDVQVTDADGRQLPVSIESNTIDVARPGQAWKVARFAVPSGTERVRARLQLDDFGGYEGKVGSGEIDVNGAPVRFEAPVAAMRSHDRAVIHLDLTQTLRPGEDDARLFLPQFTVQF